MADKDVQAPTPPAEASPEAALSVGEVLAKMGEEAFAATGGDLWNSGQPLGPQGPVEQVEKEAAPAASEDGGSTPPASKEEPPQISVTEAEKVILAELGPLVGKYNSLDELKQGLHRVTHERTEYLTRVKELEAAAAPASPPPASPPPEADPLDQLEILGLPKEPLAQAIDYAVRKTIERANAAESAKYEARVKADTEVIEKFPEYRDKFEDLSKWLDTKPELKQKVIEAEKAGYHVLAREFAWLHFTRETNGTQETQLKEAAAKAAVRTKDAKTDARVLSNGQEPNARTIPTEEQVTKERRFIKAEELGGLVELARQGYAAPLWRRAIGETLPKDVFPDA